MKNPTPPSPLVKLAWPTMAALLLSSCAGLAPGANEIETEVPSKWNAGGAKGKALDTAALPKWWERFHDPAMSQVVAEALRASPNIRTALSKIREARATRGVERAALFPQLDAGLSAQASREDRRGNAATTSENYGASLDASWEVDLFGKQRQTVRAATADLAQSHENFYAAQVSLAAETATAYIDLRTAEAQLAVLQNSIATREQTVQLTQWREQAGQGNALETQQAITSLEQARTAVPSLKQTIAQTKNQLALLAGKPPGAVNKLLARTRAVPAPPSRITLGIPAETLRQRPDVRAAEHAVNAAFFRTKAAQAERYPSLNLSGSIGVEALKAGRIFSPESTAASILGSLAAPIFDAGRITQNIHIQNERQRQALITYESTVLTALSEVENALIAIRRTSETLEVVNRAVLAAREAAKLASQRYEAGDVDLLNVLDAQRTLLSLEEQQVNTSGNRVSAHIQLYRALGGGWGSGS
jgi:NodT family efflux transporter outer membrane factor (OMF) lipoprotein